MEQNSTTTEAADTLLFAGEAWFDPTETSIRGRVRGFIEELLEQELTAALGRSRSERITGEPRGYRNGTRERQLLGSFGPVAISVPRARMAAAHEGGTREWRSPALPRYARMTRQVEALIAGAYLAGTRNSSREPSGNPLILALQGCTPAATYFGDSASMLVGYVRVSKRDGSQTLAPQRDAMLAAGIEPGRIYQDLASGRHDARPGLDACLKALQPGNTLVRWKLERLGRDLRHLVTVNGGRIPG